MGLILHTRTKNRTDGLKERRDGLTARGANFLHVNINSCNAAFVLSEDVSLACACVCVCLYLCVCVSFYSHGLVRESVVITCLCN